MMRIAEYDDVDPLQVLHLNLLCLDFALTPELVSLIRRMDPRPFPCFALYALEGDVVVGQVGVFRLPVVSTAGAAEVGGVWAVATHPAWRGQGVASLLLNEAHARMAAVGLRFVTLGTNASRVSRGREIRYESGARDRAPRRRTAHSIRARIMYLLRIQRREDALNCCDRRLLDPGGGPARWCSAAPGRRRGSRST